MLHSLNLQLKSQLEEGKMQSYFFKDKINKQKRGSEFQWKQGQANQSNLNQVLWHNYLGFQFQC